MRKCIAISVAQAAIIVSLVLFIPTSAVIGSQWKYRLLERAEVKLADWFSSPTSSMPTIPDDLENSNVVLNSLSVQTSRPVKENLALSPEEDRAFLQSNLDVIFPVGRVGLTDEQVTLEILRYLTSILVLQPKFYRMAMQAVQAWARAVNWIWYMLVRMIRPPAGLALPGWVIDWNRYTPGSLKLPRPVLFVLLITAQRKILLCLSCFLLKQLMLLSNQEHDKGDFVLYINAPEASF